MHAHRLRPKDKGGSLLCPDREREVLPRDEGNRQPDAIGQLGLNASARKALLRLALIQQQHIAVCVYEQDRKYCVQNMIQKNTLRQLGSNIPRLSNVKRIAPLQLSEVLSLPLENEPTAHVHACFRVHRLSAELLDIT